ALGMAFANLWDMTNMIIPLFCILNVFWLLTITSLYTFPDRRNIHLIFSLSIALFSGSIWYHSSTDWFPVDHIAVSALFEDIVVVGRVTGLPEQTRNGGFIELELIGIETSKGILRHVSGQVLYYLAEPVWRYIHQNPQVIPGTILRIEAPLEIPVGYLNPGGFIPAGHFARQKIYRTGMVTYPEFVHILSEGFRWSFRGLTGMIRMKAIKLLDSLGQPVSYFKCVTVSDVQAVSKALLIGSRKQISPDINRTFREAGLVHLLAISGLHVGIIAAFLAFLLNYLPGTLTSRGLMNIICIWCYAAVTGGSPSVIRAVFLVSLYHLARMLHRPVSLLNCLAITAGVLLMFNPGWITDPGFQLTFTATMGIAVLYPHFKRALSWISWHWFRNVLAVSLAAQIVTAPVSAIWFNRIGILGCLTGLPLIPLASLCLFTGIIFLLFSWVPFAGVFLGRIHSTVVAALIWAAKWESGIPGVTVEVLTPSMYAAFTMFFLVIMLGWSRLPAWLILVASFGVSLCLCVFPTGVADNLGLLEIWVLDVGNGDSTLIRLPDGRIILIDAGGIYDSDFDIGEKVVLRTLRTLGIDSIDIAIITHPHPDHQGGFVSVLKSMTPGELWVANPDFCQPEFQEILSIATDLGIHIRTLETRNLFRLFPLNINNRSLVFSVRYGRFRAFLPGDAECETEEGLLDYGPSLRATFLKVGHHGSKSSSTGSFLRAVSPDILMIPCGRNNQFGHPHYSVLQEIHRSLPDATVLRSDVHGMVHLVTNGYEVKIDWMTEELRR
ncbi:DNA internalization-related competence protein ComEC/Rec2, partial [bacterium]|nr:DNA internalization-related competence protein ComEC/Rec2 [bacterium]